MVRYLIRLLGLGLFEFFQFHVFIRNLKQRHRCDFVALDSHLWKAIDCLFSREQRDEREVVELSVKVVLGNVSHTSLLTSDLFRWLRHWNKAERFRIIPYRVIEYYFIHRSLKVNIDFLFQRQYRVILVLFGSLKLMNLIVAYDLFIGLKLRGNSKVYNVFRPTPLLTKSIDRRNETGSMSKRPSIGIQST